MKLVLSCPLGFLIAVGLSAQPALPVHSAAPAAPAQKPSAPTTAPAKQTELTDKEKVEMWEILGDYQKLSSQAQTLQQSMQAIASQYESKVKDMRVSHNAGETCTLDQVMRWQCSTPIPKTNR